MPDDHPHDAPLLSTSNVWLRTDAADSLTAKISERREARPPAPVPPAQIGKYLILGELGRGGMGVVYRAFDPTVERVVALKVLLAAAYADEENWVRFEGEARAMAQVRHPHIAQLLEFDFHEDKPYFVLEYLEGGSLAELTQGKPQPPREAALLVAKLAEAIHAAHEKGIIHRDLKPANILLTADGDPKITDFGLAKLDFSRTIGDSFGLSGLTRSGDLLGTPQYMAPEQAQNSPGTLLTRSADLYALGAILYTQLVGRPPFDAPTPVETLLQVVSRDPVPLRRLQPHVPPDLETICLKCLEKRPDQRYASGQALADDLRRFLNGQAIEARPAGLVERARKWARRYPTVAALTALLAIVTIVGLSGIFYQWREAEQRAHDAAQAQCEAEASSERATRARQEAETALYFSWIAQAQREVAAGDLVRARELLTRCQALPDGPSRGGWEWNYLNSLCQAEVVSFKINKGWPWEIAFSPDGRRLAVATGSITKGNGDNLTWSTPGAVEVRDAETGKRLFTLGDHPGAVERVRYSPDGRQLLSFGRGGTVRLHDAGGHRRAPLLSLNAVDAAGLHIPPIAFSPDGSEVLLPLPNDSWGRFDVHTGEALGAPRKGRVSNVVADGAIVQATEAPPGATVEDFRSGEVRNRVAFDLKYHGYAAALSPDGGSLATFHELRYNMGRVYLWDVASGRAITVPSDAVNVLAYSPDGAWLATAGGDKVIRLWSVSTGELIREYRGHSASIRSLCFHPHGNRLASGDQTGVVKIWDLTRPQDRMVFPQPGLPPEHLVHIALSPDGHKLSILQHGDYSSVETWELPTPQRLSRPDVFLTRKVRFPRADFSFSADGRLLAAPLQDEETVVQVLDVATGKAQQLLHGHRLPISALDLSATGRWVATIAVPNPTVAPGVAAELKVWDAVTGQELAAVSGVGCDRVALSRDGRYLAGAGRDERMRLWEIRAGQAHLLWERPGNLKYCAALAFNPTGDRLASAGFDDATLKLWDVPSGTEIAFAVPMHCKRLTTALAFSPDGRRLATNGYDGDVQLWDVRTGTEVLTLFSAVGPRANDIGYSPRVVFSADGRWLAANDSGCIISIWGGGQDTAVRPRQSGPQENVWLRWWHAARAEEARKDRRAFAEAFHRQRLLALPPAD